MRNGRKWAKIVFIFFAASFSLSLFLGDAGASQKTTADITKPYSSLLQLKAGNHILGFAPDKAYLASTDHLLSVRFIGARGVTPTAGTTLSAKSAASKESSPGKVIYQNLWEGITLTYEATAEGIAESTYHIAPGADVSKIGLRYNVPVEKQKDGSLKFKFQAGNLIESAPVAWQDIDGKRRPVDVAFLINDGKVGFHVGEYDGRHPLIIDPTWQWHTFYGTHAIVTWEGIAVDGSGNVYVTGACGDTWNGPPPVNKAPLHAYAGGGNNDIFVLKLDSNGVYQWHTFYGATAMDYATGVGIDGSGNAYVTGWSIVSWNGPSGQLPKHAFSGVADDIFVLKLDSAGAYQWHTFYGSGAATADNTTDWAFGIAVDGNGNSYVTGMSDSSWNGPSGQPPLNPITSENSQFIFVLKLNSGGAYQWHTFYGGGGDWGQAIALDGGGNAYVTGYSYGEWTGPSPADTPPLHGHSGDDDIFVLKLSSGGAYQWHTFYGSDYGDHAWGIATGDGGNVFVTGRSFASWNGPPPADTPPLHPHGGDFNAFVLKLTGNGAYQWHTFYGPSTARGIAVDGSGNAYATGLSQSWDGPDGEAPWNAYSGSLTGDIFVLKLMRNGDYLWHTFHGVTGINVTNANGIAMSGSNDVYVAAVTNLSTFTGPGGELPLNPFSAVGDTDALIIKLGGQCGQGGNVRLMRGETLVNYYSTLQSAYTASSSGDTIQAQAMVFTENPAFSRNVSVEVSGGYNCGFMLNPGLTTVNGYLTFGRGDVTVENLLIK